jgi:hypothetical protein
MDVSLLNTPDKKALYDLMVARCEASNKTDMAIFRSIYVSNSPELDWIQNNGIPMWRRNGMHFKVQSIKKVTILGDDAAGRFVLNGVNSHGRRFIHTVEALYVKQGNQWKLESTATR